MFRVAPTIRSPTANEMPALPAAPVGTSSAQVPHGAFTLRLG